MQRLVNLLKEKELTIGSIESLTGGLFASEITSVPGASKVYKGSIVTYATSEKINLLHIDKDLIDKYGVVSKEVAYEMASKGRKVLDTDLCVSFTGNAGPTCEPGGQPVGKVFIGISDKNITKTYEFDFQGDRNLIRNLSKDKALELLLNFPKF